MASKEKCVGDMILPYLSCFTLKLFSLYGYVIFLKQPSWSKTMYTEHWRKLARTTFLGHFVILFVQVCGSILNSCLHECATVFPIKSMFSQNIWLTDCFDFLFWFSSAILLSKIKSLFLNLYTSPQWLTSLLQLLINAGCVYWITNSKISANEILIYSLNVRGFLFLK